VVHLSTWISRSCLGSCLALAVGLSLAGCGGSNLTGGGGGEQAGPMTTQPQPPLWSGVPQAPATTSSRIPGASATVGLLVPMSGSNAGLGKALSQAAEMALFDAGDDKTALVVRDSEGPSGPNGAAHAAIDQGANILLGPVFAQAAKQVQPVGASAHVPVLSFTTDRSVAGSGLYVMGILPGLQIDREIGYAASQGYKRFAAVLPNSPYGQAIGDALGTATAHYNVALGGLEYYEPNATEFSGVIEKLANAGPFDAVVIPEGGFRIRAMVQLFNFYKIDTSKVKLLGSALWDDPSLAKEPALAGAWFAAPPSDGWNSFAQRYKSVYGENPPRRASLAYDAMTIASALGKTGDFSDASLTQPNGFTGIDGPLRFRPDGVVERNLAIIEVRPSGPAVKDPPPATFQPQVY
jgi:branched-chain amino acid transport system substrate-binding protein